jgi:membrane-associated phospholipid phosphatase
MIQRGTVSVNMKIVIGVIFVSILAVAPAAAQQPADPADPGKTGGQTAAPAGTAVAGDKDVQPTEGFLHALTHNLGDDVRHIPRKNSVYWLALGGGLALAVHPIDDDLNPHFVGSGSDSLWRPGHVVGAMPVVLGSAAAAYILGRATDKPRLRHLGMDEIEATLLATGFSEGLKLIVRRDRPLQADGNQSPTFSFPSGHATLTFAAATVFQQHFGYRAAIPTYLAASYVAMSRLHDNRHFASDVVFGAGMGIVIGRSVTWHGRNFYTSPTLVPGGVGIMVARR